jgi:hypothetical protein
MGDATFASWHHEYIRKVRTPLRLARPSHPFMSDIMPTKPNQTSKKPTRHSPETKNVKCTTASCTSASLSLHPLFSAQPPPENEQDGLNLRHLSLVRPLQRGMRPSSSTRNHAPDVPKLEGLCAGVPALIEGSFRYTLYESQEPPYEQNDITLTLCQCDGGAHKTECGLTYEYNSGSIRCKFEQSQWDQIHKWINDSIELEFTDKEEHGSSIVRTIVRIINEQHKENCNL